LDKWKCTTLTVPKLQKKESAQPEDAGDVKKLLLYLLDKNFNYGTRL